MASKPYLAKHVISVLILNEDMFPQDALLHHRFRFADRDAGLEWTDLMEGNVLELPKARRKKTIDSSLDTWLKFLAADRKEEFMQLAQQDASVAVSVKQAHGKLTVLPLGSMQSFTSRPREQATIRTKTQVSSQNGQKSQNSQV